MVTPHCNWTVSSRSRVLFFTSFNPGWILPLTLRNTKWRKGHCLCSVLGLKSPWRYFFVLFRWPSNKEADLDLMEGELLFTEDPSYLTQRMTPIRRLSGLILDLPAKLILGLKAGMWGSLGNPGEGLIAPSTFRFEKHTNVRNYVTVFTNKCNKYCCFKPPRFTVSFI